MLSIVIFLIGFGLTISGGVTLILYMNFLPAGISWYEYFHFIVFRIESYFFPVGMIIIYVSITRLQFILNKDE